MKKWVYNRILQAASKPRYSEVENQGILKARISEVLYPFQKASDYLGMVKFSTEAKFILKQIWGEPLRVKDLSPYLTEWVSDGKPITKSWIYHFLHLLTRYKIIDLYEIDPEEHNIPYNRKYRIPYIWYLKGKHSKEDLEEWVIQFTRREARQIGRPEDRIKRLTQQEKKQVTHINKEIKKQQDLLNYVLKHNSKDVLKIKAYRDKITELEADEKKLLLIER